MSRIQRETVANLLIAGFCLLMFIWAIPTYTPAYPGYGASPALVGNVAVAVMMVMAVLSLVRLILAQYSDKPLPPGEAQFPEDIQSSGFTQVGRVNFVHLATFMVPCFLFVFVIEYVPYLVTAFIFLMILQLAMGNRNWGHMVIIAAVMDAMMYAVMRYGFGVPVPGPQLF